MTFKGYAGVNKFNPNEVEHRRDLAEVLNGVLIGKLNATTTVTLTASATTTTLNDARLSAFSYVDFMPLTANAATAKANIYITNRNTGSLTINHASSVNTDQDFVVLMIG